MGVVYEAQDTRLPRTVAVKFLKPALSKHVDAVKRFKREARLAASLNHPNICTILDVDEIDGQSFIAMELLRGCSLRDRLAQRPMGLEEILAIGVDVSSALAAAHDQGIMHRDITPGNIFITDAGLVKLLDFGLAKHFTSDETQVTDSLTEVGVVAGTVHYMAPELFDDPAALDHRSDLFSLGVVLYQMATGARPFEAKSKNDIIALIRAQPHIPLRRLAPQHPAALERIVNTLLAKRPDDRLATARLLGAELDALRQRGRGPVRADPGSQSALAMAVLPFAIIGAGEPAIEYFRDGLAEDISERLSHLPHLRVAPRTSTTQLASRSIRDMGRHLNVQLVLEGSVQHTADRVRVLARLFHASDERPVLPSIRVERPHDESLSAQDEIASEIVHHLAAYIQKQHERPLSEDEDALHAFKRGQHHWQARFNDGWRPAIEEFQRAVEHDSGFALAHVALASAYDFLGFHGLMKPVLAFSVARQAVERALELDETLSAAHAELALIKFGGDWDWDGSEQSFRRALQLDPQNAMAHVCYAWLLILLGREDAAFGEAEAGHALAPASRFASAGRAQTLYLARQYDAAIELCNDCLRGGSHYAFATSLRGQCYELKSMFPEAIADLERTAALTNRAPFHVGILGHCYGRAGMRAQAISLLEQLDQQRREMYVPPQCQVFIYAGLGQRAKALEYQDRAYEDGASPFNYLAPTIRDLYALDPNHKKRLEQMRLDV